MADQIIKMIIADDQELIRRGLSMMLSLEPDIAVLGQAVNGEEALELARRHHPDIALMDLKMPGIGGVQAIRAIRAECTGTQVVVLTTYDTDDMVFDAIRAGAHGYLLKDASELEVLDVVRAVHRGESVMDTTIARKVMNEFKRATDVGGRSSDGGAIGFPAETLTDRETETLQLLAVGHTNSEIAGKLFLSEGTVRNYVSKIMAKLHTNDRTQLAIKALRTGIARL